MTETTMPAIEAEGVAENERNSYEFAFHILPTVAEGEVAGVFDSIKAHITKVGEIIGEEVPERIDLAYPIVKPMEGKNRKFASSYFGWVRFKLESDKLGDLAEDLGSVSSVFRHLLIKLTAVEEAHPFRFHENRKSVKMVEVVNEDPEILEDAPTDHEENTEVSEEALDESLEKITHDESKEETA